MRTVLVGSVNREESSAASELKPSSPDELLNPIELNCIVESKDDVNASGKSVCVELDR